MIVAIHQPNFLPWLGYFYKMARCDIFVFLDNIQYTKNSFINRNRIKTPQGKLWLTVPAKVKGRSGQLIRDVEIDNKTDWRNKHLKTLEMNYKKANIFKQVYKNTKEVYFAKDWNNLCAFNVKLLHYALSITNLRKKLVIASELKAKGKGTPLLINIVKELGGDTYLSGFGGANYQQENLFRDAGIALVYSDFKHPVYPQLWGEFVPNLSIIDLLFNCGSESLNILLSKKDDETKMGIS